MEHPADAVEFKTSEDQEPFLERLRALIASTPDASLSEEEGEGPRLHIDAQSPEAAQTRANSLIRAACDGADFDPADIRADVVGGWPG